MQESSAPTQMNTGAHRAPLSSRLAADRCTQKVCAAVVSSKTGESESIEIPQLIAFCGPMYAGKDFCADSLRAYTDVLQRAGWETASPGGCPLFNFDQINFADALKDEVAEHHQITRAELSLRKGEFRKALQVRGAEARGADPDYWIKQWYIRYAARMSEAETTGTYAPRVVLVTDCRYPNEARFIQQLGGVVLFVQTPWKTRVERGVAAAGASYRKVARRLARHESERSVGLCQVDDYVPGTCSPFGTTVLVLDRLRRAGETLRPLDSARQAWRVVPRFATEHPGSMLSVARSRIATAIS